MKPGSRKNTGCFIIVSTFVFTAITIILIQGGVLGYYNFTSLDISLSNTHLCKMVDEDCLTLENNVFFENEFSKVQVCTQYSSSEPASLAIYLYPQNDAPAFGMLFDRIERTGSSEICYYLLDVVDSLESSNIGGKFPSPVHDGNIDQGNYKVVFEQGREALDSLHFEVIKGK